MIKVLDWVFLIIILCLSTASLIALFVLHCNLCNYSIDLSPKGVNYYLFSYGEYKALFLATVSTIACYFGLLRLKAATDANTDKLKIDRFSEWKLVSEVRFLQFEKENDYMKRGFIKLRYNLFQDLFELKFSIKNKAILKSIFDKYFKTYIQHFEEQNEKCLWMGAVYPDENYSYSFDAFQYVFRGCLEREYEELYNDLQQLYLSNLSKSRTINASSYQSALHNYIQSRKK